MGDSVFIDTNIILQLLFKTSLTQTARKTLDGLEDRRFYMVLNVLLYVVAGKYYQWRS